MSRIAWVDATAGASGDMLMAALADVLDDPTAIQSAVSAVLPASRIRFEDTTRAGLRANRAVLALDDPAPSRTWRDVRALVGHDERATAVFARLAAAEGAVHGIDPDDVHFHEVGALDAIADVVGVCAGFAALAVHELVVSTVAVGAGRTAAAHGSMPVPVPAVAELLRGFASYDGPGEGESCTPTGAALVTTLADRQGGQPAMSVERIGVGAGGRDPRTHANVVRILVGEARADLPAQPKGSPLLIETNVDDLDPRLWPAVIEALLGAGASDAWLSPILMKKGRPAHTLSVLTPAAYAPAVRRQIFRSTSSIGVRETLVDGKHALDRRFDFVDVGGHPISVKIAALDGEVLNVQPEYDEVVAAAAALGRPVKDVLAEAQAAAERFRPGR